MGKLQKIKLSIPKPCTEDWNKMTVSEQGHICSSCQKSVLDFSNYTDRELLDFFAKAKDKICGRIPDTQLNRLITVTAPSKAPVFRRLLFGAALTAGVAGTGHGQTNAQLLGSGPYCMNDSKNKIEQNRPVNDSTFKISGRVIDSANKQPLAYAELVIENEGNQISRVFTGVDGKFEIAIAKDMLGKKLTIITVITGYHDRYRIISFTKPPVKRITVSMNKIAGFDTLTPAMIMGDMEITPIKKDTATRGK